MERWSGDRFQTVIFQLVRLIISAKNIQAQINTQLNLWNSVAFEKNCKLLLRRGYSVLGGIMWD